MQALSEIYGKAITEKEVLYFASNRIDSVEPHYYVCIKKTENDVLILSICTSQFDTVRRYVESRSLPMETLVYVPDNVKDALSPFKKETYINCNGYHQYTVDEIKRMHQEGNVSTKGILPEEYYEQIIIGLHASPIIPENVKSMLPPVQ